MVLYCKLDDHVWGLEDFTNIDALSITGTIYEDVDLTTPFDLTGYTLTFRIISHGRLIEDDDDNISIVTALSGTWKYKPASGRMLTENEGEVVIRLEKSGTQISAVGINGSADILVHNV